MAGHAGSSVASGDQGLTRQYTNSSKERIDGILETARKRSIAMANTNVPALHSRVRQSPPLRSFYPLQNPEPPPAFGASDSALADTESSADEETSIVGRESPGRQNRDYSSTTDSTNIRVRQNGPTSVRTMGQIPSLRMEAMNASTEAAATAPKNARGRPWWKNTFGKYRSIELENKGSVARDHLALERTFLAWLRTSLGFASIGIAVTQLFRLNVTSGTNSPPAGQYAHLRQIGKPLGATFLGISIFVLFMGFHRYFESQHWIIKGKFPASRGSIFLVALITVILILVSLVVVLVIGPNSYEKR